MVSYILATTHWETGAYGQDIFKEPVPEQGKGRETFMGFLTKTGKIKMEEGLYNLV